MKGNSSMKFEWRATGFQFVFQFVFQFGFGMALIFALILVASLLYPCI